MPMDCVPIEQLPQSAQRVQRALEGHGMAARVVVLPHSTRTAVDAAAAIGCSVAQIVKSLVFRADSGDAVLVLASGINRVDVEMLAGHAGVRLGKADADFVRTATGFAIGGVPPVGHPGPLATFIDRDLLELGSLWAAGGTPHAIFPVSPQELVRITGGHVVPVTGASAPGESWPSAHRMPCPEVRRLAPPDAPLHRKLMLEAYAFSAEAFTSSVTEREALPLQWWADRMADTPSASELVFGAFIGEELVGAAGLSVERRERTRHKATLFGMYVRPAHREGGIGGLLVRSILRHARESGRVEVVQLTVSERNAGAIGLYARCGFLCFGTEPMAFKLGESYLNKVHMWQRVAPDAPWR